MPRVFSFLLWLLAVQSASGVHALFREAAINSNLTPVHTYVWGPDRSGSLGAAGGIGGLLMMNEDPAGSDACHFVAHDGNGNVTALVDESDGTYSARYEYGPFGEPIRGYGDLEKANPFRFSNKFTDNESGLVYYGRRYYSPDTGR